MILDIQSLIEKYDQPELLEIQFDIDLAFYHGQMAVLKAMRYNLRGALRDDPEIQQFITEMEDACNANIAAAIGG